MYLKRLELQGFKSFADRTVLEFKPGITAVIGPNGSGKSNISDAIRWVLGEQSMKSLRGAKSEDIIFAGTQSRKSLGFAEVSMVIDNEDGGLPIEYSEVTVTRKLYRTGESGYFINKVPCRLKDVLELFMDTGIGKDGYSIIGQGKVDEILSNKSEDRRHIFEEAAGIVKYRARREESEKKLEQTKINLIRINDILAEIESNLEPLKLQAEKAKKFLDLREELKNIEIGLFLYKIDTYKEKLEKIKNDKEIFENQLTQENEKLEKMQELKEKLKQEIDNLTEEIEKAQNIGFESKNKIEKTTSEINISKERITNNIQNKERLESEITIATKNIHDLEDEKSSKILKQESLKQNKEKFSKELAEKESELAKITEKLSTKELEIEGKKKELEKLTETKYDNQNQITVKETNEENSTLRKKQEEKEKLQIVLDLDKKRNTRNELNKYFIQSEKEKDSKQKEIEEIQKKKEEIDKKIAEYDTLIANYTDDRRMKQTKYNFLIETEREKEGYAKSVKEILNACEKDTNLSKGIHGVLANLISVDDQYSTAIEMALGASMQNIVTETEQDAKRMIEYLRDNKLGRATFLPITSVKGKELEKINNANEGTIGIASKLIKCDKKYNEIIISLLGKTVITENMESAIKLAKDNKYSFKIVTLDGDIINPSGSMSGGSTNKKTVNLLGRTQEIKKLENLIKEIDKKIANKVSEKENFIQKSNDIEIIFKQKEEEMRQAEISFATEKEKMNAVQNEITRLEENKAKKEEIIEKLQKDIDLNNSERREMIKQNEEITKKQNELSEEIRKFTELNKDDQKYIDDLNEDITNLKISVSSFDESGSSIEEMLERINNDIKTAKQSIGTKKVQIQSIIVQNANLDKMIKELENNIERIKQEVANSSDKTQELRNSKNEKNTRLENTEKEISKQFETIQTIKEQNVKIGIKLTSQEQDITDIINELWNEYEVTPNNAKNYQKPTNVQETQRKVNELHNQIKDIGSVNIDSIEEYKKNKERYEAMGEQRLDLENTMAKLRNIIQEMTQTMKKQFKEKFAIINKNFNEVFKELFGGGKAELVLEDEENILECGIDIRVQPTGKKLQTMTLLSGGEKALTAIAILFAILKINPAPFCILDEIEAALDDVNVYRFAEFLKKFSSKTQFLVITHRKGTMEAAMTVYGVTMEENGVSKLLSISLGNQPFSMK